MRAEVGMAREATTRSPGFIATVLELVENFYGSVVQQITPWQPPAPKLKQAKPDPELEPDGAYDPFRWRSNGPTPKKDASPIATE